MSRIGVNTLSNRLYTKQVATDDVVDSVAVTKNISDFAKTFLDDPDVLTLRKTIGLVKQTSLVDTTADSLLTVGSFGLGSAAPIPVYGDLNAVVRVGFYRYGSAVDDPTIKNSPISTQGGSLIVNSLGGNYVQQIATTINSSTLLPLMYIRHYDSTGNPGPWRMIYNQSNIVGTVAQAAGQPTGAVIEYGSNSNGTYTKFADGTMICTSANITLTTPSCPISTSLTFIATLPATFVNGFTSYGGVLPNTSVDHYGVTNCYANTSNTLGFTIRNGATTAQTFNVRFIAIGRWYSN